MHQGNDAPTTEALRAMMALAAATASAAAGDITTATLTVPPPPPRYIRHQTSRSAHNRRQSISHLAPLMLTEPLPKGAPLPPTADGSRWRRIAAVATEIATKWQHPPESSQYETDTLHHVRAILYMNKSLITQSFVSHVSGVSQGSLSHYVRGLFRGNQKNVEHRLSHFVRKFAAGDLDPFLEEARAASRPLSRSLVLDSIPTLHPAPATSATPNPPAPSPARPPIPPPPPPQLQPAPWARPSPSVPAPSPPQPTSPSSPAKPPPVVPPPSHPAPDSSLAPTALDFSPVLTERARRARQRRIAAARAKRGTTPFTSFLDHMSEPTPVVAVEQAFHALVAPNWTPDYTHLEPLLLPIHIYVPDSSNTLNMYTHWDVNNHSLAPETLADNICRARGLSQNAAQRAAWQIRHALFDAGILCPPPPNSTDTEHTTHIRIQVELTDTDRYTLLRDQFQWHLGMGPTNSPELFAQYLCIDSHFPQKHAPLIANAIRQKLVCAQAIAYGDHHTRKLALDMLPEDDPLRKTVASRHSAFAIHLQPDRAARKLREAQIADAVLHPLLDAVQADAQKRAEERQRKEKEEAARKKLAALRAAEIAKAMAEQQRFATALQEVDKAAVKLQEERGLDFRPYLAIKMARGERPGVWTPAVFDRKRRRQTSFPMIQPTRTHAAIISTAPRLSRRRRASRREMDASRGSNPDDADVITPVRRTGKRDASFLNHDLGADIDDGVSDQPPYYKVKLVLRVRPPGKRESKVGGSSRKRRRR